NERALAHLERLLDGRPPGRTLVLGAGGCRLAYDLHRLHPDAEVLVIDLDPVLFTAARAITAGGTVRLHEANLDVGDRAHAVREWRLAAPHGPVDDRRFHFLLADAVDPPLAPG